MRTYFIGVHIIVRDVTSNSTFAAIRNDGTDGYMIPLLRM
jgi:hypothetical protein